MLSCESRDDKWHSYLESFNGFRVNIKAPTLFGTGEKIFWRRKRRRTLVQISYFKCGKETILQRPWRSDDEKRGERKCEIIRKQKKYFVQWNWNKKEKNLPCDNFLCEVEKSKEISRL